MNTSDPAHAYLIEGPIKYPIRLVVEGRDGLCLLFAVCYKRTRVHFMYKAKENE